jgi:Large polyvalent protein-associated domain 7
MGIADRVRDALRPDNSIEPSFEPVTAQPKGLHGANHADASNPAAPAPQGPEKSAQAGKRPPYTTEPESIAKVYYVEERNSERRYFEDYKRGNLAMRATDTSIMSKREDLNTIRAMLEIAEARGWHSVEIRGSAEFKREAWIEATARGLEGRGFAPSDLDRQEAERRRAERAQASEVRALERTEARQERAAGHGAAAAHERKMESRQAGEPPAPTTTDSRRVIREAQMELSQDGRLMLAALSEKIERQMNKLNSEAKTEMKAFVASELVKKERTEGPIVLSGEQKRAATAPQPAQAAPKQEPVLARRIEPDAPARKLGR